MEMNKFQRRRSTPLASSTSFEKLHQSYQKKNLHQNCVEAEELEEKKKEACVSNPYSLMIQLEGSCGCLGRLQDSNAILSHFNEYSERFFAEVSGDFTRNTRFFTDLDYIFQKLRESSARERHNEKSSGPKYQSCGNVLMKNSLFFEGQRSGRLPSSQRMKWRKESCSVNLLEISSRYSR